MKRANDFKEEVVDIGGRARKTFLRVKVRQAFHVKARMFWRNPMDKDTAIGARGLGFHSQAGQIGHSFANGSPPLQCFFGAVVPRR